MELSRSSIELPDAGIQATLTNIGGSTVRTTPTSLLLAKRRGEEVEHVFPVSDHFLDGPLLELRPGETYTWAVEVGGGGEADGSEDRTIAVSGLGPGTYVLGLQEEGFRMRGDSTAEFEAEGSEPSITPVEVESTSRSEDVLEIETLPAEEDSQQYSVRASRVDGLEQEPPEMIPEQLLQYDLTRTAVHYLRDAEELLISGGKALELPRMLEIYYLTGGAHPHFTVVEEAVHFGFDGEVYELRENST